MAAPVALGTAQLAVWGQVRAAYDRARGAVQARLDALLTARDASLTSLAARTGLREDIALRVYGSDVMTEYAGRVTDAQRDLEAAAAVWAGAQQALASWAATGDRAQGFSPSAATGQLDEITDRYAQAATLRAQARPSPGPGQSMTEAAAVSQVRAATADQLARLRRQYG